MTMVAPIAPTADVLVSAYIAMREQKRALENSIVGPLAELEAQMYLVQQALLDICKEIEADSIKTKHGLVMRQIKTKYWTNDWESFYRMVKEQDAFGLLEKRIHQTHMKEFIEENPDIMPEGLNIERAYSIIVRKPTGT